MSFEVGAAAYGRFMGRFAEPLAVQFAALTGLTGLTAGQQVVLDVGCGPGALTAELVRLVGADSVSAVDPSESFVAALHERLPAVEVHRAGAEALPFPTAHFDVALAQLVVHFMAAPVAGLAEMARVTRPGGLVAACVWDQATGTGPLAVFWQAVRYLDPDARDESGLAGVREGHLAELMTAAGLLQVESSVLTVRVGFTDVEQWWEPYTLGVGPAGAYVARLSPGERDVLRDRCATLLPSSGPFEITASAWAATARKK
jgi:SAM-dependent methyltransferase